MTEGKEGAAGEPAPVAEPAPGTTSTRRFRITTVFRVPQLDPQLPAPKLRLRLRTKLVVAMTFAALAPVLIVALLATGVILSSLEASLREDAARQLTVGLNLVLRAVERLGDECIQLSESGELTAALALARREPDAIEPITEVFDPGRAPPPRRAALEAWIAREASHVPSARLQVLDASGEIVLDRTLGGADTRFKLFGVTPNDPAVAAGREWVRGVSLVAVGDVPVMRAVSPVLDASLALRGLVVMSTPLDGDFADAVKGALSADVLLGGPSGKLAVTFRSPDLARREQPLIVGGQERARALRGERVVHDYALPTGSYKVAATALFDNADRPIGLIGVALDRGSLERTKALAVRTLIGGGLAALAFSVLLAVFWSRRLGAPIARLHRGAFAVSRGDLDHRIDVTGGDELMDLANAFNQMTSTLKDNQARLAARMREIVALHDAGRAVSSVIDLNSVARKIVDAVARTFDVQLVALWLVDDRRAPGGGGDDEPGELRAFAARSRRADVTTALVADEALAAAGALSGIAAHVRSAREPLRLDRAGADPVHGEAARAAGAPGPLVALPLERKARVVGVLAVGRAADARGFSDADLNLLVTFADQAGAAVENALLYSQVRTAGEELEKKVHQRTRELTATNQELARALADLREMQAQLVLSERMAGLGVLVAGVAHEVNSPTAAIRGSIDGLGAALARVVRHGGELAVRAPSAAVAATINMFLEVTAPQLAERPLPTGLTARRAAREVAGVLERAGLDGAPQLAADLADLGATAADAERLVAVLEADRRLAPAVVAALTDHVYLHRTDSTVRHAVQRIQRIVGALKTYSHLDQQATRTEADLHEGIETTLVLLDHALRDIVVQRHYGNLPRVPVYVDELNQVWTNLISNAQQALKGKGTIMIETTVDGGAAEAAEGAEAAGARERAVVVRVIDDGPGVSPEVQERIFEPFFTTKPKGEGTGLGLGIARRIVDKHGGEIRCESRPGRTVFEVRLPIAPPEPGPGGDDIGAATSAGAAP
jgi:signal transduction histidine kinase